MMWHVPGVKMSGCINQLYVGWRVILIDTERTCGYTLYTIKKKKGEKDFGLLFSFSTGEQEQ
jgi:hypothetical protein